MTCLRSASGAAPEVTEPAEFRVPRIGSLCSGYGGLELGLITAIGGGDVVWHVEHDRHPAAVLEARFPGVPNYGDVKHTDWSQVEPVDWLTAGYPCQPFSMAGKRKGTEDDRHLWPFVADAIGVLRPRHILLENVASHLSLGFDVVLGDLATLGYDATWGLVRASEAGACHGRSRLFVLAADTDAERRERGRSARGRRNGPTHGGEPAADPQERPGHEEHDAGARCAPGGAARLQASARGGDNAPADADRSGSETWGGRSGTGDARRLQPVECGPETLGDAESDARWEHDGELPCVDWSKYGPAVDRWGRVLGRPAPAPTERGTDGKDRMSAIFVEWMMGLPAGWVTDVLPRNPALKCLGNGVVPLAAGLAVSVLLHNQEAAA